jgi:hypothetical protein
MSGTANLAAPYVVAAQNQKEVTLAEALDRIDAALTETFDANVTAGNVTLTTAQYQACLQVRAINATVSGRTVTLPQVERLTVLRNDPANTQSVGFVRGSTTLTLAVGETVLARTDGTTNGLVALLRGNGTGAGNAGVLQDEGSAVAGAPHSTLNFTGSGVTVTNGGSGVATITIPGGESGITLEDEGSTVTGGPHTTLNFVGAGVAVANAGGGEATITVTGGGGGGNAEGRTHVVPVSSSFTWVNQGTATVNDYGYGFTLRDVSTASITIRALVRTAPSTPYSIVARVKSFLPLRANSVGGLCWRESSSGKITSTMIYGGTGAGAWRGGIQNWTNASTFASETVENAPFLPGIEWTRLRDDGTNRYFDISVDGDQWWNFWSASRTTHLTPDQVGIMIEPSQTSTPRRDVMLTLLSWEEL